jgi:hypothetical protein
MSDYTAQINAADAMINKLSSSHNLGFEFRDIDCIMTFDFKNKMRIYTRCDTGEMAEKESMREEDFQERIGFPDDTPMVEVEGELMGEGTE